MCTSSASSLRWSCIMRRFFLGHVKRHLQASLVYSDFLHSPSGEYLLLYGRILSLHSMFPSVTFSIACRFAAGSNKHQDQGAGGGIGDCSLVKKVSESIHFRKIWVSMTLTSYLTKASYVGQKPFQAFPVNSLVTVALIIMKKFFFTCPSVWSCFYWYFGTNSSNFFLIFSSWVKYSLHVTFSRADHWKHPLSDDCTAFTRVFFREHCKFAEYSLQGNSAASYYYTSHSCLIF